MNTPLAMSVFEVIGSPLCVASSDGQKLYERLLAALEQNRHVSLSFLNVSTLTSAFLNAAIGQLYGALDEDRIRELLDVDDIEEDDRELLRRVVDTAKLYFEDPERFKDAMREVLGEEDDGDDA